MNIDFNKMGGLVPAIIQDEMTSKVLMLGYMHEESLSKTQEQAKLLFSAVQKTVYGQKGRRVVTF
jgi:phosphoribosyl-AMP cyclohydrolase / phosphoribosyl-ATP pyrophosphohydrolase